MKNSTKNHDLSQLWNARYELAKRLEANQNRINGKYQIKSTIDIRKGKITKYSGNCEVTEITKIVLLGQD